MSTMSAPTNYYTLPLPLQAAWLAACMRLDAMTDYECEVLREMPLRAEIEAKITAVGIEVDRFDELARQDNCGASILAHLTVGTALQPAHPNKKPDNKMQMELRLQEAA